MLNLYPFPNIYYSFRLSQKEGLISLIFYLNIQIFQYYKHDRTVQRLEKKINLFLLVL